jgi:hypothetical protein
VSLHLPLLHHGTDGGVTAITQALTQQGREPVPSRRTLYRIVRRHHQGVKELGASASMFVFPVLTGFLLGQPWSTRDGCGSSPEPAPHWRAFDVSPVVGLGRDEDTAMFLGRRQQASWFLPSSWKGRENLNTCVVQPRWGTRRCHQVRTRSRLPTLPESTRRKKSKHPLTGYFCPLTTGGLIRVRRSVCTTPWLQASLPSPGPSPHNGERCPHHRLYG